MNFRQLESFRAVMSYGSVTRAAEAMRISQPAVSRLISDLEATLGLRLFERKHGRLRPTSEAHLLFQESNTAFSGLARLREAATSLRELKRGRIRIASETVYSEGFVPHLAAAYHLKHKEVRMELDTGPSSHIPGWIAETWYDLGLVVLPVPQTEISVRFLRRQSALCAVPLDHMLSEKSVIKIEEFAGERFIAAVATTPFRVFVDRAFKNAGIEVDVRLEARTQHGILTLVGAGAGIALVDPCVAVGEGCESVKFIPVDPAIHWDIALVLPKVRLPSLICLDFVEYITKNAEKYFSG
ncbi:LysR substrate-binding domain-containing protein [Mesorhizobium sp. M0491]|uniref:LysR substrate-binding domain-containing protein n=1 Tax=Mesorhizobium sp. M0491 TaxID=2956950 RepID=UPI00333750DC